MDRTAVPIGQGHMFKRQVIRHIVASVDEDGQVRAACGASFKGATRTWQDDRPCARCYPRHHPPEQLGWCITFGDRDAQAHMPGGVEGLRHYCLTALKSTDSKALARAIARFLGYDPPERILAEHPELEKHKIEYASPAMEAKYDYSRKITKASPFTPF